MRSRWINYLLLLTFAYWATGAAKYFHELIEHHGGADNCIDDDDDCQTVPAVASVTVPQRNDMQGHEPQKPAHHGDQDCVICKSLAAMAVDQPIPVVVPELLLDRLSTAILHDWHAPVVRSEFSQPTTGPPVIISV